MSSPNEHQPPKLTPKTAWPFYRDHFIKGFCRHLPLPLTLMLLVAMTLGWFGARFGTDDLIWHEVGWQQFIVGFAVVLLTGRIFFLAYLLETQSTPPEERYQLPFGGVFRGPLFSYLAGVFGAGLFTLLLVYFIIVASKWAMSGDAEVLLEGVRGLRLDWHRRWGLLFVAGGVLSAVVFLLILIAPVKFPALKKPLEKWGDRATWLPRRFGGAGDPAPEDRYLHGMAFFSVLFALLFYCVIGVSPFVSPMIALCLLLDAIISIYAFISFFLQRWLAIMILLLAVLVLLGGVHRYKYSFPGLQEDYKNPRQLADYINQLYPKKGGQKSDDVRPPRKLALLKSKDISFCNQECGPHQAGEKRPVVIICASGGGIRAAAWTVAVLEEIEKHLYKDKKIRFPYHIRIVTGASGGMLGAAYYNSLIKNPKDFVEPTDAKQGENYNRITNDFLTPAIQRMVYGDLGMLFLPLPNTNDRGLQLENSWRNELGKDFADATFAKYHADEKAGWRPSLIFSPMLVEDGRRLLISNLDMSLSVQNDSPVLRTKNDVKYLQDRLGDQGTDALKNTLSISAYEFFRLFPHEDVHKNFRIATAARMSATFPYISPAAALPTEPRRRVVDAGYFDNYGVSLAAAWLFSGSNRDWLREHASGVVLIQIRDSLDQRERMLLQIPGDRSTPFSRGLEWLTSPPSGLYSSTTSASALRNDELLEVLARLLAVEQQIEPLTKKLTPGQRDALKQISKRQWLLPRSMNLKNKREQLRTAFMEKSVRKDAAKVDQLVDEAIHVLDKDQGSEFFTTINFELDQEASLSWYLTAREKEAIQNGTQSAAIQDRIAELISWWERRTAATNGKR